ncbi:MAG: nucleotidyltransferase domain-containing protein [Proteobacteria bacterium]|nr:nucleotidyltransferase domain-containing protein [Pseudomonadota bacterium]
MSAAPIAAIPDLEPRLARALVARDEILEAYLFGSQASGRAQPHSDIDVAVYIDPSANPAGLYGRAAEVTAHLMDAVGSNDIDVLILNDAPPVLYHRVLRDGNRLFARDLRATTAREGRALSRYCDFLHQMDKVTRATRRGPVRAER